jgi:hypothetical protein
MIEDQNLEEVVAVLALHGVQETGRRSMAYPTNLSCPGSWPLWQEPNWRCQHPLPMLRLSLWVAVQTLAKRLPLAPMKLSPVLMVTLGGIAGQGVGLDFD